MTINLLRNKLKDGTKRKNSVQYYLYKELKISSRNTRKADISALRKSRLTLNTRKVLYFRPKKLYTTNAFLARYKR